MKRLTPEDTVTARRVLLDGLARDADISGLVSELALLHPRDNTFPGEVLLHLAADALDWCSASRADPLPLEGLRERFLPECTMRGRETRSSDTQCWPEEPSMVGSNRTCLMRSSGGRPTTSGSTPCSRRSPTSGPPPAGRACRCARHARTWLRAPATQRHNDHYSAAPMVLGIDVDKAPNGGYRTSRPRRPASPGAGCSADQSAARWLVTWPGAARLPRRHAGWSGSPLLVHQVQLAAARDIVTGCWPGPAMSPRCAGLWPTGIGAAGLSRGARRMP